MTFGEKLRELREAKGMSQAALATEAELMQSSIARWERGSHFPPVQVLQAICDVLGVKLRAFEGCDFGVTAKARGRGRPKKDK